MCSNSSSESSKMVTNVEVEKEVDEKKKLMEEKTRLLDESIEEMKDKLKEMENVTQDKEGQEFSKGKEKLNLEDKILEPNPPHGEQEPLLKSLKAFGGKILENVSLLHGKMDIEVVLEWIETIEN